MFQTSWNLFRSLPQNDIEATPSFRNIVAFYVFATFRLQLSYILRGPEDRGAWLLTHADLESRLVISVYC